MTDIGTRIDTVAQQPSSANITPSSTAVTNQSIPDLIEADKYQRAKAVLADGSAWPMRTFAIKPPGAT